MGHCSECMVLARWVAWGRMAVHASPYACIGMHMEVTILVDLNRARSKSIAVYEFTRAFQKTIAPDMHSSRLNYALCMSGAVAFTDYTQ
jgi:hypothetical protein